MGKVAGIAIGLAGGAALAGIGLWLGARAAPAGSPPVATVAAASTAAPAVTTVPEAPWTDGGGVRFESTVIIVDGLEIDEGAAVLDYRLIGLGNSGGFHQGGAQLPSLLPDTWVLTTASGEVIDAVSDPPRANFADSEPMVGVPDSIRFEPGGDQDLSDVAAVAVTGWRVAVPAETVVEMAGVTGATAELHDGTVIVLDTILEQRTGTIVDFDLERPPDPWRVAVDQGFGTSTEFVGAGTGWLRASSTIGGLGLTGGITGFQLVWGDSTAPEVVRIQSNIVSWEPILGELLVWEAA
jgi:hypothetical protein